MECYAWTWPQRTGASRLAADGTTGFHDVVRRPYEYSSGSIDRTLSQLCYPSINHFFFSSGGGDANDSAIKTARFFWNSSGQARQTQDHQPGARLPRRHDRSDERDRDSGVLADVQFEVPGFLHIPSPYPYRYVSDNPNVSQGRAAADELEKAILREGAETVAAFLAEPVQGAGGLMVPQDDYFPRIREICDKYDVLFMADEVITGFGRLGRWFGLEHWKVQPDIISFAKGITSGYLPLGGIGMSDRVFKILADAPPDSPLDACIYVFRHIRLAAPSRWQRSTSWSVKAWSKKPAGKERSLLAGLKQLASLENVGDVRGLGLMCGVELVEDKATKKRISGGPQNRRAGVSGMLQAGARQPHQGRHLYACARLRDFRCRPGSLRQYPWRGHPGRVKA